MKTLPVAVQVYSVREDAEKDFAGTMKKIKEIGYDGVELAGLYGLTPQEVKAAIEDAGLVLSLIHILTAEKTNAGRPKGEDPRPARRFRPPARRARRRRGIIAARKTCTISRCV